jgi:two-component system response regulator QseB
VAVRRSAGRPDNKILISGVSVDITRRQVRRDNDLINLTSREFTLLLDLIDHVGHVRSRSQLEECLYGWGEEIESNSVEVHIHHLRKKLGKQFIKTVHGVGYIIEPQVQ